jgi:hypothetical protein
LLGIIGAFGLHGGQEQRGVWAGIDGIGFGQALCCIEHLQESGVLWDNTGRGHDITSIYGVRLA